MINKFQRNKDAIELLEMRVQAMPMDVMERFGYTTDSLGNDHFNEYKANESNVPKEKRDEVALDRLKSLRAISTTIQEKGSKAQKFHLEASLKGALLYASSLGINTDEGVVAVGESIEGRGSVKINMSFPMTDELEKKLAETKGSYSSPETKTEMDDTSSAFFTTLLLLILIIFMIWFGIFRKTDNETTDVFPENKVEPYIVDDHWQNFQDEIKDSLQKQASEDYAERMIKKFRQQLEEK
jgi:hypothetical protein|tara:strand:+ start:94 stop:813 length:720 start_codon:yes stop_codon:yes gene_type:complete